MDKIPNVSSQPSPHDEPITLLQPSVIFPFLFVSLVWGATWLVIRDQLGNGDASVPASWSVTYRFAVATMGMFMLAIAMRLPLKISPKIFAVALVMGFFQFFANFNFVYRAEIYITSGLVAVCFALLMIPNSIMATIWLNERINRNFIIGSAIAVIGVGLLFVQEYRASGLPLGTILLGTGFAFMGVISASIANIVQALERAKSVPLVTLLAWSMLCGAVLDGFYAFIFYGPPTIESRPTYLIGVGYLAIIGSVATFPLYFGLVRKIGASRAAYTSVVVPIVAMILSTIFEGYLWSPMAVSGAILACIGLVIAMQARKPRR